MQLNISHSVVKGIPGARARRLAASPSAGRACVSRRHPETVTVKLKKENILRIF